MLPEAPIPTGIRRTRTSRPVASRLEPFDIGAVNGIVGRVPDRADAANADGAGYCEQSASTETFSSHTADRLIVSPRAGPMANAHGQRRVIIEDGDIVSICLFGDTVVSF